MLEACSCMHPIAEVQGGICLGGIAAQEPKQPPESAGLGQGRDWSGVWGAEEVTGPA